MTGWPTRQRRVGSSVEERNSQIYRGYLKLREQGASMLVVLVRLSGEYNLSPHTINGIICEARKTQKVKEEYREAQHKLH